MELNDEDYKRALSVVNNDVLSQVDLSLLFRYNFLLLKDDNHRCPYTFSFHKQQQRCGYKTDSLPLLLMHYKKHFEHKSNVMPFECLYCKCAKDSQDRSNRHMKRCHAELLLPDHVNVSNNT